MSLSSAEPLSSGRAAPRRPLRAMLKMIGSLWLTVLLLIFLIATMLWGTIVEKYYGANAAKFGIYGAWWFNLTGLVLGINSAASLVLRWPWKRQHLGFVLPHLGLIVLLLGCYVSRRYGVEATLTVIEGQQSDRAFQGPAQHVELDGAQRFVMQVSGGEGDSPVFAETKTGTVPKPIEVPFTSGPFNWEDYENGTLTAIPWSLAHRDRGTLYDRDGIRLEVLDYLSNSEIVDLPSANVEADKSRASVRSLPFDKGNDMNRLRQAHVRLTVDGQSDEFWLPCAAYDPLEIRDFNLPKKLLERTVAGKDRQVKLRLVPQSFRLGYSVRLNKAWAKTDPGSRMKSFYASEIDLVPNLSAAELPPGGSGPREYKNLLVTLNAPLDFTDPRSGKSFRMFQSTMNGPLKPQQLGIRMGDPVYVSGLSLNDDPGRGLTYVGCLLVVAGIFAAYFIRIAPAKRKQQPSL